MTATESEQVHAPAGQQAADYSADDLSLDLR
jgi:hypothetical protein